MTPAPTGRDPGGTPAADFAPVGLARLQTPTTQGSRLRRSALGLTKVGPLGLHQTAIPLHLQETPLAGE
ncbi:MAG TPA: hypothetical protein VFB80_23445 [Pirellulaceae bacterium]|nr:hypothetical protein [Pirellulaceae bacterium]